MRADPGANLGNAIEAGLPQVASGRIEATTGLGVSVSVIEQVNALKALALDENQNIAQRIRSVEILAAVRQPAFSINKKGEKVGIHSEHVVFSAEQAEAALNSLVEISQNNNEVGRHAGFALATRLEKAAEQRVGELVTNQPALQDLASLRLVRNQVEATIDRHLDRSDILSGGRISEIGWKLAMAPEENWCVPALLNLAKQTANLPYLVGPLLTRLDDDRVYNFVSSLMQNQAAQLRTEDPIMLGTAIESLSQGFSLFPR